MNDGEIDLMISFNPSEAAVSINAGLLPDSVRTFVFAKGTIGNTSFVAIPYNAAHKEGAMVVADFLLEPATQAHAQDYRQMGNFTVLDLAQGHAGRAQALRRPAEVAGAAHERGTRHDAARAASVVDDAHRRGVGEAVHEVNSARRRDYTRAAPALTIAVFLVPIAAGLVGTLLPAFGYLPAIGGDGVQPRRLASPRRLSRIRQQPRGHAHDGRPRRRSSRCCSPSASARSRMASAWMRRIGGWLAPILATPHSAIAIGLAFLIAPSGWIVRALSPWLTGWTVPPDVATVGDAAGLALVLGLLLKEVPYLVLMIVGALQQVPVQQHLAIARSLGYARAEAWVKVILPQIYPQIRLPIYAVIAFSLSVVDVALILGPSNPPTLAVLAVRWFTDADIQFYFPAAAAATLLLLLVVAVVAAWYGGERIAIGAGRRWIARGRRRGAVTLGAGVAGGGLRRRVRAVGRWRSSAWRCGRSPSQWRFPDALPQAWSLANWMRRLDGLAVPAWHTLLIGTAATAIALVLVLGCLENEARGRRVPGAGALWILYVPLLVPQVAFLFGAQVLLVRANFDGTLAAVVWAHLDLRAAVPLPVAGGSVACVRSALCAHRGEPRRVAGAGAVRDQAADPAAPGAHRLRGGVRRQRRPVSRDAVRRQRPHRHADHRCGHARRRGRPARDRRLRAGAGAVSAARLRRRGGVARAAVCAAPWPAVPARCADGYEACTTGVPSSRPHSRRCASMPCASTSAARRSSRR